MKIHGEERPVEVWIGNTSLRGEPRAYLSALTTRRLGEVAYYIDGGTIPTDQCRPVFVQRWELNAYNRIMDERFRAHA